MLELEEQLAEFGDYLDTLDATDVDAPRLPRGTKGDVARRVGTDRKRTRTLAVVAACVLLIGTASVLGAVALSHDDGRDVRVAAPSSESRSVSVEQLPRADTDLFVYFLLDATDEQVAGVRTALNSSPDVVHYAFLDHDAARRDFADVFACRPDLVQSANPEDLPVSFRVATTDADAVARVETAIGNAPGVQLMDTRTNGYAIPARSDETVTPDGHAPCEGTAGQGATVLPDRVQVEGTDGNFAGYVDRPDRRRPDYAAFPGDPEAAAQAWMHTPVPVTRTADPTSELVGYTFPNIGFVDLATYNSPSFDLDARLADAAAEQNRTVQAMKDAGMIP